MAPKGKAASKDTKTDSKASASKGNAKGKGKSEANAAEDKSKVKASQFINVRHILCEKHGKKEEALEKLRAGENFGDVAKAFSEDKPRVGKLHIWEGSEEEMTADLRCRWTSRVEEERRSRFGV